MILHHKATPLVLGAAALAFVGLMLNRACTALDAGSPRPAARSPISADAARSACRQFLLEQLHDPDTADVSGWASWPATAPPDQVGTYVVDMRFRARNAFGALVLSHRLCSVTHTHAQGWRLLYIK